LPRFLHLLLLPFVLALPTPLRAQDPTPAVDPPLAHFAAQRVAIMPAQLFRADTVGWSREASWSVLRADLDRAITAALKERGLGSRWAYAEDVVRTAKRNPIYTSDPTALGVGRWRSMPPKLGETIAPILADNLRPITALGDTRYALIPVELRGDGDAGILRIVIVDTRARTVAWYADLRALAGPTMIETIANGLADLILEP
jgi:hypothetical protein